jgi:hypothetical protein
VWKVGLAMVLHIAVLAIAWKTDSLCRVPSTYRAWEVE